MEDSLDLKVKIFFGQQALVIYLRKNITIDAFYNKVRDTCKLPANQPITMKWIDVEDDPCTISSQVELNEAVQLTGESRDAELKLHIFLGMPLSPGAPCPGEDKNVYRRGARRWVKKIYNVQGHSFQPKRLNQRTECALCSDTIWGLGRAGLRCMDCGMCVHKKCHKFVNAECTMKPLINNTSQPVDYNQNQRFLPQSTVLPAENYVENKIDVSDGQTKNSETTVVNGGSRGSQSMSLDDFDLLTVIGRGSYAKVIQAEHKKTGRIYAIKIIKKTLCDEEEDIDWVQTEKSVFETASNHPFLVGLHSCFQTETRLLFVIEFIPGGDLMFHMQRQKKLPEDHARFYAAELILALHFLHSRRIVYRDLKLDNVMLDAEGHIKLTDFGMCKENVGPNDLTNTFCGTPNYIAPEILRGEEYGFSVDFWSLGILMYEMMAGRSPFHLLPSDDGQDTDDHLFQMILERVIRIPRHLSVRAASVLKGFLKKEPADRLGCKPNIEEGLQDIKTNAFFKFFIDWDLLEQRQVQPPYCPNVANDRDLQRFDTSFINEEPTLTPDDPALVAKIDQSEFEGFEYINPLIMSREDTV